MSNFQFSPASAGAGVGAPVEAAEKPRKNSQVALEHVQSLHGRLAKCPVNGGGQEGKAGAGADAGERKLGDRMSIYDLQQEDFEMLQHLKSASDIKIMI